MFDVDIIDSKTALGESGFYLNNYKKLLTFDKKECKMILINLTNME